MATGEDPTDQWRGRGSTIGGYEILFPEAWVSAQDLIDDPGLWDSIFAGTDLEGGAEGGLTVFDTFADVSLLNTGTTIEGSIETFNLVTYLSYGDTLDRVRATGRANLEAAGLSNIQIEDRMVAGREAVVIDYTRADFGFTVARQYNLLAQEKFWVFIFSGNDRSDPALWDQIMETLTIQE